MEVVYCLSGLSLLLSIFALILILKGRKTPKWEYYKQGIRFYNNKNEVTIETEKSLK